MDSLKIKTEVNSVGIKLRLFNSSFDREFKVEFSPERWEHFPNKPVWAENLAYLATVELALMLKVKEVEYDTPFPIFKPFFDELFLKYFPYCGDVESNQPFKYLPQFSDLDFLFFGKDVPFVGIAPLVTERSMNTLTFGKESLLSFGLAQEIGLNPAPFTVIDEDLDLNFRREKIKSFTNKHLWNLIPEFEQEKGLKINTVKNELCKLRCNVEWDLDDTDLGSANVITEFLFLSLPLAYAHHCKYILFGNEHSCNNYYYSAEGARCYPVYDQSSDWIRHLNGLVNIFTQGKMQVVSLVQPLSEMAVAKILYQRYPQLAKYQMSCHADDLKAEHNRWCGNCAKCATCFVFMKAFGFDPNMVGLKDMFEGQYKPFFSLFNPHKDVAQGYYTLKMARDEQLLAFYLATKRGASGGLIDLFKEEFMAEAVAREKELVEEIFKLHPPENIPAHLWEKVKPILEEELKKRL